MHPSGHKLFLLLLLLPALSGCGPAPGSPSTGNDPIGAEAWLLPFLKQVETYPDSLALYEELIDTLANRGRFADAARWCDSVMVRQTHPQVAWLFIKGDLYRMGQMHDSAIVAYRRYLQIFPDDEQIELNLASSLAETGQPEALVLTQKIMKQYPAKITKAQAAYINGIYYNTVKNNHQALAWFDTAIARHYHFAEAWMERGYTLFDAGRYAEAVQNFRQFTTINAAYAEAWYWLGKSEEAINQREAAMQHYHRAYALDRNITEARRAIERLKKGE